MAVVAAARKMVTIAFLMLKNNEPYRYATPLPTRGKLARLRIAATGERKYAKPSLGKKGRPANYGSKVHQVRWPGLAEVYATEGLPADDHDRYALSRRTAITGSGIPDRDRAKDAESSPTHPQGWSLAAGIIAT